jgi:hypothetical protein
VRRARNASGVRAICSRSGRGSSLAAFSSSSRRRALRIVLNRTSSR